MSQKILICTNADLVQRVASAWGQADKGILRNALPFEVEVQGIRPQFPSTEQINYLESIGIKRGVLVPQDYRFYIGREIKQTTEQVGGVELPVDILFKPSSFYREVVERIREVVGSPEDIV